MIPRYDSILMLSGGKDSSFLAYSLDEQGRKTLGVTVDVGFMSDVAKQNIERLKDDLRMDHLWIKSQPLAHSKIIEEFRQTDSWGLPEVCGRCSGLILQSVFHVALSLQVKQIYAGFTKYTASTSSSRPQTKLPGGIIYENPYLEKYDLPRMTAFLEQKGFVTDPTKTNCRHIREIILTHVKRFGVNPYEGEFAGLLKDGQISPSEMEYYREWCRE